MPSLVIKGLNIHQENEVIEKGFLAIVDGKIAEFGTINGADFATSFLATTLVFPEHWHLVPGMIDIHIHGGYGSDVMDGEVGALENISKNLPQEGVTSFLATTMTMNADRIENSLVVVANYKKAQNSCLGAELLGVNLEGPFIAEKKAGAQDLQNILAPNIALFKRWQKTAGNSIKLVTLSPEVDKNLEMVKYLTQQGITVAFGHSDADYEQGVLAIQAGCNHVTHLFNAMRGLHHREPNAIMAFLLDANTSVELIADGIHLHPAILQLVFALKGADQIVLISDAMRAKGMGEGVFEFGGHQITVKNKRAGLTDFILAGSVLSLDEAMRNMITHTACSLTDAVKMVTVNPAKKAGVFERKGSIALHKDADLVVLNEKLEVMLTICRGEIAYEHAK